MWTFWSKIAFGLQIIHQNRFKMHLKPATFVFECLYQSTNISKSTRIHLCIQIDNLINIRNNPSKYILRTCNMGKQSGCLHLVKVQSETRSWSTGLGPSLMHTYEQGVLERRLSGKMHIQVLCFHNRMLKNDHFVSFLWFKEKTPIQNECDAQEHW